MGSKSQVRTAAPTNSLGGGAPILTNNTNNILTN